MTNNYRKMHGLPLWVHATITIFDEQIEIIHKFEVKTRMDDEDPDIAIV